MHSHDSFSEPLRRFDPADPQGLINNGVKSVVELGRPSPNAWKMINERDLALNKMYFILYMKVSF